MSIPIYNHLKNEIKINIYKHNYNDDELVQFSDTDLRDVHWIDTKEFVLKNVFYDVAKIEIIEGHKVYFCLNDERETQIAKIDSNIQNLFVNNHYDKILGKIRKIKQLKLNVITCKSENLEVLFSNLDQNTLAPLSRQTAIKISEFITKMKIPPQINIFFYFKK